MRVALVVMPFADADRPSLAVGLLQAGLERRGISCDSKYFNVTLRKMLGHEAYDYLSRGAPMTALAGEWAFSQIYFGRRPAGEDEYRREVLDDPAWGMSEEQQHHVQCLLETAPLFLRLAFESNDWSRYDLVGFTSTFEQTMPSLALARMIRESHPGVLLAAGGANFEAGMGRPYMENFEFLDFVSTGEADDSFPQLCCNLRDLEQETAAAMSHAPLRGDLTVPPGFLFRRSGEVCESPRAAGKPVDLDQLATPSYDDFFRVAEANEEGGTASDGTALPRRGTGETLRWIPVETARGCWWGEKAHCTFCGLNGESIKFRKKSWRRVVAETDELIERHPGTSLQFADNILGMTYFRDLLPFWAARRDIRTKFFEIKSNLTRKQVRLLKDAGVTSVQAGVESLADDTLRIIRKGVSAAQNIALLRWCVEVGIQPMWNILYGFPGENPADYDRTLAVLSKMTHLPPPDAITPIRMDRFSPNHTSWRERGFTQVAPIPAYRHIFPFPDETLEQLAYYFSFDHPQRAAAAAAASELHAFGREWVERSERQESGELAVKPHRGGGFNLIDSRFNSQPAARGLSERELALLVACDGPVKRTVAMRSAEKFLSRPGATTGVTTGDLDLTLADLINRGIIAVIGARLITLALLPARSGLEADPGRHRFESRPAIR